jgi:hypothetical protein
MTSSSVKFPTLVRARQLPDSLTRGPRGHQWSGDDEIYSLHCSWACSIILEGSFCTCFVFIPKPGCTSYVQVKSFWQILDIIFTRHLSKSYNRIKLRNVTTSVKITFKT